jgi:hypothetical protein
VIFTTIINITVRRKETRKIEQLLKKKKLFDHEFNMHNKSKPKRMMEFIIPDLPQEKTELDITKFSFH